ncbi:putative 5-formyltetrahydrofolate cyclo-ligase [Candidatus Nitrososphaera gargensis Ga9.2]|uniref:Putative 5-formyltetrahydrofolate cyclo-ligase n=2 Tax=Candidatus Nitrososphaera gargensis TaxID=497727 RepID=K0IND6_NITGG|nr:putative 5-formyltetrahydrofolate cyclo-ligase [Candidatus Nitrososphaera gargensis Ga9.2]
MLEKRNRLDAQEIVERSKRVQEFLINSKEFQSAKVVGAYYAFGSEVRTDLVIEQTKALGKKVALPSVEGENLTFYELSSGKYLVKGRFGIMEPLPYGPVDRMDLLVVPGIAFDRKGYRLGYGKGYYDKFLAKRKVVFSIGLAYSFQLLDNNLPLGEHDKRLDAIATEDRIIYV